MRTTFSLRVAFLLFLSGILPTHATTYYVATDGDNSNLGDGPDPADAFRTIQHAIDQASYGDIINVAPGIYRETIVIGIGGISGNPANGKLKIQAWDPDHPPTITASLLLDDWDLVTDETKWKELTGWYTADFSTHPHKEKIYVTDLVVNLTPGQQGQSEIYDTVNLVMQSVWDPQADKLIESNTPLIQTRWYGVGGYYPSNVKPFMNEPGTYYYDTAEEKLYVWRSDGEIPGPDFPIEAFGNGGSGPRYHRSPIYSQAPSIHLKGLKFRHSNTTFLGKSGVSLDHDTIVENCDIQWMDWQGLTCKQNCEIINCNISNNGNKAASMGAASQVINCDIIGNNFRLWSGGVEAAGIKFVGDTSAGCVFSGNRFIDNFATALWFDFVDAPVNNRCVIANNFFSGNSGAIDLEDSSGYKVFNNISHDGGIALKRSRDNIVVHNTFVVPDRTWDPPPAVLHVDSSVRVNWLGLKFEYYENGTFSGQPAVTQRDLAIDFVPPTTGAFRNLGGPSDGQSFRWTDQIWLPVTGTYTFWIDSAGPQRLTIDGVVVIDDYDLQTASGVEQSGAFTVQAARWVDISYEVIDPTGGGDTQALLKWATPYWAQPRILRAVEDPSAPTGIANRDVLGELVKTHTTGNVIAYNLLLSRDRDCMISIFRDTDGTDNYHVHDNTYKYNMVWNIGHAIQMNIHPVVPPATVPDSTDDVDAYFTALAESPQVSANIGNRAAEPDFFVGTLPTTGLEPEDFHLKWESPAKDVAGTEFGITTDIFGNTRDSYPDLGAIEISNADTDGDGIADVWEMYYAGNLTTFGASTDYNNDSFSDKVEFERGTNPLSNTSKNITLYANGTMGLSSLDGFSATKTSFIRGPKATITSALNKSLTGDAVRVAGGTYSENVDISSRSISFFLDGNVVLQ